MSDLLKEAIREYFGERCPDFDPGCPCCRVWAEIDEISRLCAQNAELLKALRWYAEGGEFRLGFDNGDIARTALRGDA